jgi:hypothetical protein
MMMMMMMVMVAACAGPTGSLINAGQILQQ